MVAMKSNNDGWETKRWVSENLPCRRVGRWMAVVGILCGLMVIAGCDRMAAGEAVVQLKRKKTNSLQTEKSDEADIREKLNVRPVSDRPILWRELHMPLMGTKRRRTILIVFTLAALIFTYWHTWRGVDWDDTHMLYTMTYMLLTLIGAAILSATTISSERESSTWEALLTTPLTACEIVYGKVLGVLKRLFPIALLYFAHIVLFALLSKINTLALVYMLPLMAGPVIFLVGTGTLISSKVKHTTTSVMLNLGTGIFVWAILPFIGGIVGMMTRMDEELVEAMLKINPLVLNFLCFDRLSGTHQATTAWSSVTFDWPINPNLAAGEFTVILAVITGAYILVGALMTEWAIFRIAREKQ
jgi:ABC-type transport system involved in multi-copper enzyme maturation permease subunit